MRADVLRRIRATPDAVVLFDVDSTLLSTGARHLSILRAYAAQTHDEGLQEFARLLTPAAFGWTVTGPLERTAHAVHTEALQAFWWDAFFSADHLADEPTPGALGFVQKAHRDGAWIYYLTARDVPTMGAGTARQLIELGFPLLEGRATLHLKPSRAVSDAVFKQEALRGVARAGTVVATYENEPLNANLFAQAFPDASHYLLETVCSPEAPPLAAGIQRIADFT